MCSGNSDIFMFWKELSGIYIFLMFPFSFLRQQTVVNKKRMSVILVISPNRGVHEVITMFNYAPALHLVRTII